VVSRLLADDDAGAGSKLGQQYREGAAEPDHHQPRARLNPARRDRADQLLELRLRLRLDRLARVRRARAFAPQRPADRNGRHFVQPVELRRDQRLRRADRRGLARLRLLQPGQQSALHRSRRGAHALRAGQILPQLLERRRDRARNRDGRRSRSLAVCPGRLAGAANPGRRGGGLRRLEPELDANRRILGSDDGDQSLS
jgi:hypothetical protein